MSKYVETIRQCEEKLQNIHKEIAAKLEVVKKKLEDDRKGEFQSINYMLNEAKLQQVEEQAKLNAEKIKKAKSDVRVGTIYVQWDYRGFAKIVETGKTGICEVVTEEYKSLRKGGFEYIRIGDLAIRYLLKNGSRGKMYDPFFYTLDGDKDHPPYGWFPLGVTPERL